MTDQQSAGGRRATVIVASTRAAAGTYEDKTGPVIAGWLAGRGWTVEGPLVVADGPPVAEALDRAVRAAVDLVITTGGTGISPSDMTADATAALLDVEIPGFMEELRRRGAEHSASALLTRGHAGIASGVFVVNLPGSSGGVRDGLDILDGMLDHALDQLAGGTH